MRQRTIVVETTAPGPSLSGHRDVVAERHVATAWSTAHGGDLIVLDGVDVLAIYARGVWRRAYFDPQNPS